MSMIVKTPADDARRRRLDALAELLEVEGLDAAAAIVRADYRAFITLGGLGILAGEVNELVDVDVILLGDVAEHVTGGAFARNGRQSFDVPGPDA